MPRVRLWVHHHQYFLVDTEADNLPSTSAVKNGLIGADTNGVCVLAGLHTGPIWLDVEPLDTEPALDLDDWEEIVEIGYPATSGALEVSEWGSGERDDLPDLIGGPGEVRVRISTRGRPAGHAADALNNEDEPVEEHRLQIWPGPGPTETVHKTTDRT
ncbi:hypothetical protein LO762_23425 [Actinocorallia sp. API 0066]|uniref:hypothetical protein n=1 Tax=Actinocorallia sp. API 0066 TaxID=2896846 RepID=UPI001E41A447|nr:hypothetical protein [Actinocorallia sp. API 0066]MCD0452119.1 hypothetical protein [Actinocorallia sp. API 0066]